MMLGKKICAMLLCLSVASCFAARPGFSNAMLINQGNSIFSYPLSAETKVQLTQAKIQFSVAATVSPSRIKQTLALLNNMRLANKKPLEVSQFNQTKTSTGLINIEATLSGVLPVAQLQSAYDLVKQHSKSGMALRVASIEPYFPLAMQQREKNALSLKIYQQAQAFALMLSKQSGKQFRVAAVKLPTRPGYAVAKAMQPLTLMANTVSDNQAALPLLQVIRLQAKIILVAAPDKTHI